MPDSPVLDGGARFPEVMTIRLPLGFLERIRVAAKGEVIAPRDFVRRAVSERLLRLEAKALATDQPLPAAVAASPSLNALAAHAGGSPMSGASASTAASTKRRDA